MIMVSIKEALTFDDVTLTPKFSEVLPSEVSTEIKLSENLWKKIEFFKSDYIASKDVNAWLGLYKVNK